MILTKYPYNHFVQPNFLLEDEFTLLYDNLNLLVWELYQKGSYQYWVSSLDYECSYYKQSQIVINKMLEEKFVNHLSGLFNIKLSKCKDATFHKMEVGHFSKRHTDANNAGEKIRLILYFSQPSDYKGGELVLYSDNTDDSRWKEYKFQPNTVFGFEMSEKSFHEAKKIESGVRLCLVLTYL